MIRFLYRLCLISVIFMPRLSQAALIDHDTTWSGEVVMQEDFLVLPGATLTIAPGTVIHVEASENTKTEPEFLSPLTELTVRGKLKATGSKESPITFAVKASADGKTKEWAGIFVDGGTVSLTWTTVQSAESGLTFIKGEAEAVSATFQKNRYGLTIQKSEPRLKLVNSMILENDYGLVLLNGATVINDNSEIRVNRQKDLLQTEAIRSFIPPPKEYRLEPSGKTTTYGSEVLLGNVIWKDRILINGVVRLPEQSKLIILPGTVIEFSKRDTNGDGIGENGMLVLGMLVAKGTAEQPIIFRSAESKKNSGDWDSINLFNSDGFQNMIEYCQVEDAYRAIHAHFSNLFIGHSVLRRNLRGMQFQESLVEVVDTDMYNNSTSVRARDSEVSFSGNRFYDNLFGPNLYRATGTFAGNLIAANFLDGARVREGALEVRENTMFGNRYGLTLAYADTGVFSRNVIVGNSETGIAVKGTDRIQVKENFIQGNGANGISLLDSLAVISGNHIALNDERGIGIISFAGEIRDNNLINNKLYAIGMDGDKDVAVSGNWWGGAVLDEVIFDKQDDPSKGRLDYGTVRDAAVPFVWPTTSVDTDTTWFGEIQLPYGISIKAGTTLKVAPATTVKIGKDVLIWADGNIEAVGEAKGRIRFTSLEQAEGPYWDQITTELAKAIFVHCDFENANMALHSHFSNVLVKDCSFFNSESGFRFRGGPVEISRSWFQGNVFGIVSYFTKARVIDNVFTGNDVGILVRNERNGGMMIAGNNIYKNKRYNLRVGDFNEGQNVDAKNNWWGGDEPLATIFDDRAEPGVGLVYFEPFAKEAFDLQIAHP